MSKQILSPLETDPQIWAAPQINMGPPPVKPVSGKTVTFQNSVLGPRPKHIVVNNVAIPVAGDEEVKRFYKPSLKPRNNFTRQNPISKNPPPIRANNPYLRSRTPPPRKNNNRQNRPQGFHTSWNNFQNQSFMPWGMIPSFPHPNQMQQMHGMFNSNNFGPMRYWGPNV